MAQDRLNEVRSLLQHVDTDAVLIALQKNVSWFMGGRSHVNTASELACASILVTREACVLAVNNIEAKRLIEEEFEREAKEWLTAVEIWNWYDPGQKEAIVRMYMSGRKIKTDSELEPFFLSLRNSIPSERIDEISRYGLLTGEAIERTAELIQCGDTEFAIAGKLAYQCYERELEPIVNLVAADDRAFARRHPLPTGKTLEKYAMLVVCTRKNGLVFSATRLVHFGTIPDELARKQEAVARIDARLMDATRPGTELGAIFEAARHFYAEEGYAEEYTFHHQGGLTGFTTREKLAIAAEPYQVAARQMYAWNPSISGVKSEDTIIVTHDGANIITSTGHFPYIDVVVGGKTYRRPAILRR